jgi:hypothetical protein
MEFALKQYQTSVENNAWGVNSKQQKSIMNLAAQVGELKKWRKDKIKKEKKAKQNQDGKSDEKKEFISAAEYRKKRYEAAPKWMKAEPRDGKTTKKVKDVEYHWCTYHKLWQKHKPEDCRLNPAKKDEKKNEEKKDEKKEENNEGNNNRRVRFAPASNVSAVNNHDDF